MREFAQWLLNKEDPWGDPLWWVIPASNTPLKVRLSDVNAALQYVLYGVAQGKHSNWAEAIEEEYPILTRDERALLLHNLARWHRQWQEETNHETAD